MNKTEIEEYFEAINWFEKLQKDEMEIEQIVQEMFRLFPYTSTKLLHQGFFMAIVSMNWLSAIWENRPTIFLKPHKSFTVKSFRKKKSVI